MTGDRIRIEGLRLETRIGVPDEERRHPQTVEVSLDIFPSRGFAGLGDRIECAVDYQEIVGAMRRIASEGERQLIETLAEDLAEAVLGFEGVAQVAVEVKKFILPETSFVSVTIARTRILEIS